MTLKNGGDRETMVETTDKLVFAKDINRLRKPSSYKKFEVGYFTNVPDMGGYIYRFKVEDAKIILIVDTANSKYKKAYYKKEGWHFLIYKCPSIEQFTKNLADFISDIVDRVNHILDEEAENADKRAAGIPHGYKLDENGEIVVDPIEAPKVRKIYKLYTQYDSIRKVADVLKSNFSHVRDVLHDYRYENMALPIISDSVLKKARAMMEKNRKNRVS